MASTYTSTDAELLAAAAAGEEQAWEHIVARYQPLVDGIARRHRLPSTDALDVSQYVWMQLVSQVSRLREPAALPGWIATTATRKCYEVLRGNRRATNFDPMGYGALSRTETEQLWSDPGGAEEVDEGLLREEQRRAVREGLAELTAAQRQLLLLLVADPPVPYKEISDKLGMPLGSIGPTRSRLLKKLGESVAVRRFVEETPRGFTAAA